MSDADDQEESWSDMLDRELLSAETFDHRMEILVRNLGPDHARTAYGVMFGGTSGDVIFEDDDEEDRPGKSLSPEREDGFGPFSDDDHQEALAFLAEVAKPLKLMDDFLAGTLTPEQAQALLHALGEAAEILLEAEAEALVAVLATETTKAVKSVASAIGGFFAKAARITRTAFLAAALALGGPGPLGIDERKVFAAQVASQQSYLNNFQAQVESGRQPADGTLVARAGMYGQAAWSVAQNTLRGVQGRFGLAEERRVLGGNENNCVECPELAAMGWQPVGSMPPIGEMPCRVNCRCHLEYRGADGLVYHVPSSRTLERKSATDRGPRPQGKYVVPGAGNDWVQFVPDRELGREFRIVYLDPARFDQAFAADAGAYIAPGGTGGVPGRYGEFKRFYAKGIPIEASRVGFDAAGNVAFDNGRHRYAVLRDLGFTSIPVLVTVEDYESMRALFGSVLQPKGK